MDAGEALSKTSESDSNLLRSPPAVTRSFLSPRISKKGASSCGDLTLASAPVYQKGTHSRTPSASPSLQVRLRKKTMKKPNGNIRPKSIAVIRDIGLEKTPGGSCEMPLVEAIYDKRLKVGFRKFLESEFSVENLDFWLAAEEYKKIKDKKLRRNKAQEIYEEYISPGAPKQINLDFYTRQQIMKQMSTDMGQTCNTFIAAQRYVFTIMENDSYGRFLASKYYDICSQSGRRSPRKFLQDILHNTRSRNRSPSPSHRGNGHRLSNPFLSTNNNNNQQQPTTDFCCGHSVILGREERSCSLENGLNCGAPTDLALCSGSRVESDPELSSCTTDTSKLRSFFSRFRVK